MKLSTMLAKRKELRDKIARSREWAQDPIYRLNWARQCAALTEKIDALVLKANTIEELK